MECFNICSRGCLTFIIQLFNRNVTNMTQINNIARRQKIGPRPQAFNINYVRRFIVM